MSSKIRGALASIFLILVSLPANAQLVAYFACDVDDVPTLVSTIDRFFEGMADGPRPAISLDSIIWNGENRATHRITVNYENYQAFETFRGRSANSAAAMQLRNSIQLSSDCFSEGLAIERRFWGNRDADPKYIAVYPAAVTNSSTYAGALDGLMTSAVGRQAPGPVALYENRAGEEGVTHYVAFFAPTLTALNEYLDRLLASDTYTKYVEDVRDIRELRTANQAQRLRTWQP